MFQKLKHLKILAMTVAVMTPLFASGGGGFPQPNPPIAGIYGAGAYSYASVATTAGAVVTLPTLMAVKTQKIVGLVSAVTAEMAEAMGAGPGSTPAGEGVKIAGSSGSMRRASTWIRTSYGSINNTAANQQWNGNSYLVMLGADYRFNQIFGAGLGLSYSHLDANTAFNNGTMKEDTYGVNPFFLVKFHKNFNMEAVGGWSHATHNDKRKWIYDESFGPLALATYHNAVFGSKPKHDALFGGIFATFVNTVNKTNFSAQVGYLWMQDKMKAFKESVISTAIAADAVRAGNYPTYTYKKETVFGKIIVGYQMTPSVMPFLTLHGLYNTKQSAVVTYSNSAKYKDPRSGFGGGLGFHANTGDQFKTSLQFDYTKMQDLSTYVTALRIHYAF